MAQSLWFSQRLDGSKRNEKVRADNALWGGAQEQDCKPLSGIKPLPRKHPGYQALDSYSSH